MRDPATAHEPLLLQSQPAAGVRLLTLNRPNARNALSLSLIGELQAGISACGRDPSIAAVVIAAAGPVYSAGHDLKEMTAHRSDSDGGQAFFEKTMRDCAALMLAIVACPKPVIAAVQGTATAAGCQLVASCDLAVSADTATFATPGVNIGLFCSTPMVALSRNVSRKQAMEMLLLGEAMTAADAEKYGLINGAVPPHRVLDEAIGMAQKIAAKSKATVATGKQAFYRQIDMPLPQAYDFAAGVMVANMMAADAQEGICAFIEKRHPEWKDD